MHVKVTANTPDELPVLPESCKGASAIIGVGFLRQMWIYVWIEDKRAGTAAGHWKFAGYPSKP